MMKETFEIKFVKDSIIEGFYNVTCNNETVLEMVCEDDFEDITIADIVEAYKVTMEEKSR